LKILLLIVYFNLNSAESEYINKEFKLNENIFLLESMFIPGAGHLYNQHYRSAILSFFTTFSFFSSAMSYNSDYFNSSNYNKDVPNDYYRFYNDRNRYLQDKAKHNTYIFLAILSYFDSILDSYYNLNKNNSETANFNIGVSYFKSNISNSSLLFFENLNPSYKTSHDKLNKEAANIVFGFSYGSLFNKEFLIYLGPQMLFNFDLSYKLFTYKYFSLILANHLDSQFQIYEFMDDGKNKSDDEYQTFNDFLVLGLNIKLKSIVLETGSSFYNISSTWDSFSMDQSLGADFSQAHVGEKGFLKGNYYYLKANVFFTNKFNSGFNLKYIKTAENNKNFNYSNAYLKLIRLNVFINYIF